MSDSNSIDIKRLSHEVDPLGEMMNVLQTCLINEQFTTDLVHVIVQYVGYTETNIKDSNVKTRFAAASPPCDNKNETAMLLIMPKTLNSNYQYTLRNINFFAYYSNYWHSAIRLIANLSIFDVSKSIHDMERIYKSEEISIDPKTVKETLLIQEPEPMGAKKTNHFPVWLNNINVKLNCGKCYIFWCDVVKYLRDIKDPGLSLTIVDRTNQEEKEQQTFMRDIYILHKHPPQYKSYTEEYRITKLYKFEFC